LDINGEVNKQEEEKEKNKEKEVVAAVAGGTHGDLDGQPKEEQSEHDGYGRTAKIISVGFDEYQKRW
jgi:hypothetical protein